jgi:PPOX class probable F420-dependent enzyme
MAVIPESYLDLLKDKKAFANLATLMPDGSPQVTPVWVDYTGSAIRVNSAQGRVKARNMTEGSRVALAILDPDNPYRHLQVRGRIKRVVKDAGNVHIDSLAKIYMGVDKYPYAKAGEVRLIFEIEPQSATVMG